MTDPRKPAAFRVAPETQDQPAKTSNAQTDGEPRRPRAVAPADIPVATPDRFDIFAAEAAAESAPPPALPPRRRSRLGAVFFAALGLLASLTLGLWTDWLVRDLFARADWLGWAALALAFFAGSAFVAIVARELFALRRLASVEKIRKRAVEAIERDDDRQARSLVAELGSFLAARPETARGRRLLSDLRDDVIDGADLIRLAETELMRPLDERARTMVLDAAKRVSVVTAVSPRAVVDVAYVLFEAGRLIRRLSELYGSRPGSLGFLRLARNVLAHLAVTGSIAVGDSFVQQIIGHGLAAKLSARLGEGVVNGMMTARIGIAAIHTVRPLPFTALPRPRMSDFLSALSAFSARSAKAQEK